MTPLPDLGDVTVRGTSAFYLEVLQCCSSQCKNLRDRSNPNKDAEGKLSEVPPFEECPKWKALAEILEEIKEEGGGAEDEKRVLILTSDERTAAQIQGRNSTHLKIELTKLP